MTDIFTRIDRYTPILCRLLARVPNGRPLTTEEICAKSGLNSMFVEQLSMQTNWDFVDVYFLRKFSLGCTVDFANTRRMRVIQDYLEGPHPGGHPPQFSYLKRSPDWKGFYQPMMQKWMRSLPASAQYETFWKPMMKRWKQTQ